jgi:hypothetical protein
MTSSRDRFLTGALLVGSGLAGYGLWRWARPKPAVAATASAQPLAVAITAPPAGAPPTSAPSSSPPPSAGPGPVSSPSRVDPAPTAGSLSRKFDPIFEQYRGSIPIEYLRALAQRESSMRPGERSGPAWGLMQIVEIVRADYNEAHGTRYTRADLLDPAVSVAMCCWVLRFIIDSYQRNHPTIPNLREAWDNPRFAELLTFGWNAGFSEKAGVGKVVRYLEKLGAVDIDLDQVHGHARLAGASRHLQNVKKVAWCKSVVTLYLRERAPRNAAPGSSPALHGVFVLRTYPEGASGAAITRWYRADPPTTWADARRRLHDAGVIDVRVMLPTDWKLVADPPFRVPAERVRPLPGGAP